MKLHRSTGILAGVLSLGLLGAGPAAAAGPANVNVRVEGDQQTLVPRAPVRTVAGTFSKDGDASHTCSGTSAGGALERATGGDWSGPYFKSLSQYSVYTIKGETHDFTGSSWSVWLNYKFASTGLCDLQVQEGDDLLFMPQCGSCATPPGPLRLIVPASARAGRQIKVRVLESAVARDANFVDTITERPSQGATVTAGGRTTTTDASGIARLTLAKGSTPIGATKAGFVRSATEVVCATSGARGGCGPDTTAPRVRIAKLRDGARLTRARAPRTLRGTVTPDPSGLRSVKLRLKRDTGATCETFDGRSEQWRTRACKRRAAWFAIGDRRGWSYLLPERLAPGRYTLEVMATDKAGNRSALKRGSSKVVFTVR